MSQHPQRTQILQQYLERFDVDVCSSTST